MKHDPSMHTVMHLVFFGKRGVTNTLNHGNQYSFLFSPCVPYKTQFSPPSFPYPRAASATTASARVLTPLPSGLLLPVGLVFPVVWQAPLSRHKLPRRGSSTQASEPPPPPGCGSAVGLEAAPTPDVRTFIPTLKVAAVTRRPPRLVSFKAALKAVTVM
jgi:hypothetical protein